MSDDNKRSDGSQYGSPREVLLSPEVRYAIYQAVDAIAKQHPCVFNNKQQDTLKHLDGMYSDLGDGKSSQGVEKQRKANEHVDSVLGYGKDAKKYAFKAVVLGLLSWVGYAIWNAFKKEVGG